MSSFQDAYTLHLLATDPSKIVPAGKSLLSTLLGTQHAPSKPSSSVETLHDKVEHAVHDAFWNDALDTLSSPEPATQLQRLKALYADLHTVLAPLFPTTHPVLRALAAPIPPTSSPLHSTLTLVGEILTALRQRCAPARDSAIDALLASLPGQNTDDSSLPAPLISTIRSLVVLSDTLKADLVNALLGSMTDAQLTELVKQQARSRERELVLEHWHGTDKVRLAWRTWLAQTIEIGDRTKSKHAWVLRLFDALFSSVPVACVLPDNFTPTTSIETFPNSLPPQLFFSTPAILYLQNYLQALVIAACLRALVANSTPVIGDFTSRIWTLLKSEIDKDEYAIGVPPRRSHGLHEEEEEPMRIINLADEVVQASGASKDEKREKELRESVERTLKLDDPVFSLLRGRLMQGLEQEVGIDRNVDGENVQIPQQMRTGKKTVGVDPKNEPTRTRMNVPVIKGFDDPVLMNALEEIIHMLGRRVEWVEELWSDLF